MGVEFLEKYEIILIPNPGVFEEIEVFKCEPWQMYDFLSK